SVFFFQAEDGIRDDLVTGVQTCALPIWSRGHPEGFPPPPRAWAGRSARERGRGGARRSLLEPRARRRRAENRDRSRGLPTSGRRSEERRVGKEWRDAGGLD